MLSPISIDGDDYSSSSLDGFFIPIGTSTSQICINVTIRDDSKFEKDENFSIAIIPNEANIFTGLNGTFASTSLLIVDDEGI